MYYEANGIKKLFSKSEIQIAYTNFVKDLKAFMLMSEVYNDESSKSDLLKKGCTLAIVVFIIRCFIVKPSDLYAFVGRNGRSSNNYIIFMFLYEKWIWRLNCFEKVPHIYGKYEAKLEYEYEGKRKTKSIQINIKQSLLQTNVEIITNEISSQSITSSLVLENEQSILYYTYITSPKSRYSTNNPIQYGT